MFHIDQAATKCDFQDLCKIQYKPNNGKVDRILHFNAAAFQTKSDCSEESKDGARFIPNQTSNLVD